MATKSAFDIHKEDIYALSDKGEKELGGSETSLAPAEIELLVRIDGTLTIAEIAAGVRLLARDAVAGTLHSLLERQFIRLRSRRKADELGITGIFSAKALHPTREAITHARAEATTGTAALKKDGYYVRIARRDSNKPAAPKGKMLSVIVVEDEPLLAKFLKQYLSFEGMEARVAANRDEILAAFRTPPLPDLVLLDVMLPDADGFDILLKMRQHPVLKMVPVVMLTAKASRESVLKGLAGGADGYITKPFEADALITAVNAVLGRTKSASGKQATDAWAQNNR